MRDSAQKLYNRCLKNYPRLNICAKEILDAFDAIANCYRSGGKLLACGNGGSASDAEHIVGELMNKFRINRPISSALGEKLVSMGFDNTEYLTSHLEQSLEAISLVSQTSLMSAVANDIGADMIFAQQVFGYGKPGDILLALSTSGKSPNILNAVKVARALDMNVIGFTGEEGGFLPSLCQITIRVPFSTSFEIQELHLPVYHLLCAMVEEEFFGQD